MLSKCCCYQIIILLLIHADADGKMKVKTVGGFSASIEYFPHAVCLVAFCSPVEDEFWVCGSSILTQNLLLTAAHCVVDCRYKTNKLAARAGSTTMDQGGLLRSVRRYVAHESYNTVEVLHDIALCLLNYRLHLGRLVQRVVIRPASPSQREGTIAGWGKINKHSNSMPSKLKWVKQTVWPPSECVKVDRATPGTFCACASSGSVFSYPYSGDSGSGFIMMGFQLVGLVSYYDRKRNEVTYYTNVTHYYNWITEYSYLLNCAKTRPRPFYSDITSSEYRSRKRRWVTHKDTHSKN